MLPGLLHQLSLGVRGLRQRLSFSLLALISLGLGIGASVAIYAVVDAVLLQPLPYAEAERLVQVEEVDAEGRKMPLAEPNLDDLRARHRGLVALAEYSGGVTTVSSANRAVRAGAYLVGPEFLQVLQVQPVIGSDLGTAGTEPGALVSHRYWKETLGASANLSGRSVSAFGLNLPIVGVMPESFQFPEGAQLWMDARAIPPSESRSAHNWSVIARLRDGVDMAQAQADARAIGAALRREHGSDVDLAAFALTDLRTAMVGSVSAALWVLLAGVGFLLLIAATNVTNLFLAQALARRQELAVRDALGAGSARIAAQFVVESVLLGMAGMLLGLLAAHLALTVFAQIAVDILPRAQDLRLSGRVIGVTTLGTLLISTVIGLIAARSGHQVIAVALKEGGRSSSAGRATTRVRQGLVVAQGALTVVLLVAAGLLARSVMGLLQQDPGFEPDGALTVNLTLEDQGGVEGDARVVAQLDTLISKLAAIPGVKAVGGSNGLPLSGDGSNGSFFDEHADFGGRPEPLGYAEFRVASAGYLEAMGMSLLRGRDFARTDQPGTPHVALVSRSLAQSTWPGRDPIGQRLQFGNMDGELEVLNVIGVVADVHERSIERADHGTVYVNYVQRPARARDFSIVVRAQGDPGSVSAAVRQVLASTAAELPVRFSSLAEVYRDSISRQRFSLNLFSVFAVVALLLAATGLYGLMAFMVSQRSAEIAVRLALGSSPGRVLGLVLRQGIALQMTALAVGLILALALTRWMSSLLFGVQTYDPLTFVSVSALLIAVTIGACWLPARRAASVTPRRVLG
ncbi:MAG: ABC transporter permease [Rhodanobacteraceae bacterium]|nr:ABC transporter permease [Rhodanobacteraceae bacterium]